MFNDKDETNYNSSSNDKPPLKTMSNKGNYHHLERHPGINRVCHVEAKHNVGNG